MGINIKNAEAERLIREFAAKIGKGQTEAVTQAVREALGRLDETERQRAVYDKIVAIAAETGPLLKGLDIEEAMYGENGLYDRETGLPK
jgi:hypothetical protein